MEEDRFAELHRLCKRNELYQQKICGVLFALFCIGVQAFSGELLFGLLSMLGIGLGIAMFLDNKIAGGEEE